MSTRQELIAAGHAFHVMNRGARRLRLFDTPRDYDAFVRCLGEGLTRMPVRLIAYCVMPNHFHLVVWPPEPRQLGHFMQWLTATHSKRWHAFRGTTGTGCVYQSRYRAVAIQVDSHLLTVCRYVERNPVRAGLVERAEDWRWSSASADRKNCHQVALHPWPFPQPQDWVGLLNRPEPTADLVGLRLTLTGARGFGTPEWLRERGLGPIRRGRPRKITSEVFLRRS